MRYKELDQALVGLSIRLERCLGNISSEVAARQLAEALGYLSKIRNAIADCADHDRRSDLRISDFSLAIWKTENGDEVDCAIYDISAGGAKLRLPDGLHPGARGHIEVPLFDRPLAAVVVGEIENETVRVRFVDLSSEEKLHLDKQVGASLIRYSTVGASLENLRLSPSLKSRAADE